MMIDDKKLKKSNILIKFKEVVIKILEKEVNSNKNKEIKYQATLILNLSKLNLISYKNFIFIY